MTMTPEEHALELLQEVAALVRESHFVYKSGKHGSDFVNKDALFPHTHQTSLIAEHIADMFVGDEIEAVLGPAVAGSIFAHEVARHLSEKTGCDVLALYADKKGDDFEIKRGYEKIIPGKKTLIVEDVLTTGSSVRGVIRPALALGANVHQVACLWNRGNVTPDKVEGFEIFSLVNLELPMMTPEECADHGACSKGVPVREDLGHGKAYNEQRAQG